VPAFVLSKEGFKTNFGAADILRYPTAVASWKPVATSDLSQTVFLGGTAGAPEKLRIDLLSPGFSLYYAGALSFKMSSTSGPILTWPEGSVEAGVPVPPANWVMLSFRDSQPPIFIAFLSGPASAKIDGKVGDWTLTTEQPYKGWIRIVAPIGIEPRQTNTAAELGALTQRVMKNAGVYAQPTPQLQSLTVQDDATAIIATWRFDRPGAVVPSPVALASIGGYPIKSPTKIRRAIDDLEGGLSLDVAEEKELTVRFPMRRIPTGRALSLDAPAAVIPDTVAATDIGAVTHLALANLVAGRSLGSRTLAQQTLSAYLGEAAYTEEPYTTQRLPFDSAGKGLDLAAAHALLMQATSTADRSTSQPNSILTSLTWRRDWSTWRLWCADNRVARRAAALAAIAGALCPEAERRLEAAMLEAGLAAERGLLVIKARKTPAAKPATLLETLDPLRRVIFTFGGKLPIQDPFTYSLLGEMRVFGDRQVAASSGASEVTLDFNADQPGPINLTLVGSAPLTVEAGENVGAIQVSGALGVTQIRAIAKAAGACRVRLSIPPYGALPPRGAAVPAYSEIDR
jgi:hypothetical protein